MMLDSSLPDQNQWVANLFRRLLKVLESLNWKQEASDVFLVYAHDNQRVPDKQADAEVARLVIKWLKQVGTNIYSDRDGTGNPVTPRATPSDTAKVRDILSSQLGLLPSNQLTLSEDKRESIVLCGSTLLGHYFFSDYYQTSYYPGLKQAYQAAQKQASPTEARFELANYVNSQVNAKDFHHVLTELAFLQIRAESEGASHSIVPLLLNGKNEEGFPEFIMNSTRVRIEEAVWRESGIWNGWTTYENEGLHRGFFKLLELLWIAKKDEIQILGEGVYQDCLKTLRGEKAPQSEGAFNLIMEKSINKAFKKLSNKGIAAAQVSSNLQKKEKDHEFDAERCLKEWYPTLIHRLAIQRVSGDILPMEHCYINLAVVEYQPKKVNKKEEEKLRQPFYRLPSFERVENTNLKKPIPLEDLFKPRELKSGIDRIPKRILIRGRAGIGKTTLAKKSLHDYLHQNLWREHFEWLLCIPLRHLKGKSKSYQLQMLFYDEYFQGYRDGERLAQVLYRRIQKAPSKTLLICDGWDEVVQEKQVACLNELLNHPSVIITSRPHGINVTEIKALDLELETVGFSEANVMAYLDHPTIVAPEMAEEIKTFMKQHSFVRELVNIPIQLDALCYSWDEITWEGQSASTMTALYQAMIHKLWRKDMVRLNKRMNGEVLTEERVKMIRQFSYLERFIKAESTCLGALALNGLDGNQLEFKPKDLEKVVQQLEKNHHQLPSDLETKMANLSCLHEEKDVRSSCRRSYQFLHLTFQEFFAAQWLVKCLQEDKSLSLVESPGLKAENFIRRHQYNPRYEIVWRLVAGLVSGEALKVFFDQLNHGPQDLIGIQHQHLIMHCLRESNGKLPKEEQERLEAGLYAWLTFEVEQADSNYAISTLGCQAAFPEELLRKRLAEGARLSCTKCVTARTLACRSTLSDKAVMSLIGLFEDKDESVRQAAGALGKHTNLPSEAVRDLVRFLKHEDRNVRASVAGALGKQSSLSPEAEVSLIGLFKDEDKGVSAIAAEALGKQPNLPSEAVEGLIELLRGEYGIFVTARATRTLKKQVSLSPEAVGSLLELCQDEEEGAGYFAASVLDRHSRLNLKAVDGLIRLFKNEKEKVRASAAKALDQQSSLSSEVVVRLLGLFKDENGYVRASAVQALSQQSNLSPEVMQSLIELSKDEDGYVRASVAQALGQQSSLFPKALQALIELCQDEEQKVMSSAEKVLGQQSKLSSKIIEYLIGLCRHEDGKLRSCAVGILGKQVQLSPKVVALLIELFKDQDVYVRTSAVQALGRQPRLSSKAVQALVGCCQDKEGWVRLSVAQTLGQQPELPPEAVRSLLGLCQDEEGDGRFFAAQALGQHSSLPPEAVQTLLALCQDEERGVRSLAVQALGRQLKLSSEAVQTLVDLCQDEEGEVRSSAARALARQSNLSPEAVQTLVGLCQDEDGQVRFSAAWALGQQPDLSPEAVQSLIRLCQDEDESVESAAEQALAQQSNLSSEAVQSLLRLCQDESWVVRSLAAKVLGQQSRLFLEAVASLIELCQDENGNVSSPAAWALGKQPAWPGYQFLLTVNPSFIKKLYCHWLIPSNFKQANPLYIEDNHLCFYTSEGLQTIVLDEKKAEFKQAILAAQQAVGIPQVSQIKTQSFSFFQANKLRDTSFCPAMPGAWPTMGSEDFSMNPCNRLTF